MRCGGIRVEPREMRAKIKTGKHKGHFRQGRRALGIKAVLGLQAHDSRKGMDYSKERG